MNIKNIYRPQAIAILTYHSLDDSGSVLSVSPRVFAEHMEALTELDAEVVGIMEIQRRVRQGGASKPIVAITFDDGFSNVFEYGFPILQRYGFPATVFLVTDYCGKSNAWPSQPTGIPYQQLLNWKEIKTMSDAGISFGSHTRTHPDLTIIPIDEVEDELIGSKKAIEDAIGQSVDAFAYPYGSFHERIKKLTQAYFTVACSTSLGFVHTESDFFNLDRLDMYYLRRSGVLKHLFSPSLGYYIRLRRIMRSIRGHTPPLGRRR